jgi:hypothetical protein
MTAFSFSTRYSESIVDKSAYLFHLADILEYAINHLVFVSMLVEVFELNIWEVFFVVSCKIAHVFVPI